MKKSVMYILAGVLLAGIITGAWFYISDRAADGQSGSEGSLAPESAVEHAQKHLDPSYTCAMHPEVESDRPGDCPICGMPLVEKARGPAESIAEETEQEREVLYWYDPMVPDQHFDKPGKSPFMDMDLVPKYKEQGDGDGAVRIDPRMVQNMGVRTATVTKKPLGAAVETVGTIQQNERAIEVAQSRVSGWVERLHVRAVGDPVKRGQPLMEIYAPEWYAAQEELLLAMRAGDSVLVEAARRKLSLLGMSSAQIAAVERKGKASRRVTLHAPASGVVTDLGVREGASVAPNMPVMTLVDLSQVWVVADVPEALAWKVSAGAPVTVQVAGLPGESFQGTVDYVYPTANAEARTLTVRVTLRNPGLKLKPGMYAKVQLGASTEASALAVPTEAVIMTGKRSVVILSEGKGRFRAVEVRTGRESDGFTEILAGLRAGEAVVVSGQFLLDSEANLTTGFRRLEGDAR